MQQEHLQKAKINAADGKSSSLLLIHKLEWELFRLQVQCPVVGEFSIHLISMSHLHNQPEQQSEGNASLLFI